ncbi:HAMP domain-containing protein [Pseudoduganella sp. FT25W]|uniref:HAMP domain-containing protein n=1 Tax=Duganella alba TaxID=2666081 RepID=A0A6L5QJ49_9BURK|nr:methyl-accepting chemotaxis protein [Duganella alba]MRX09710.1 HAMP domain-containing protein [Duganella alba]MRX17347.1 HAMP domain-containing protein [Duganella alba]
MKNFKIGTRLAAGFGLVLALMILMTVIGIRHMHTVATATRDMMQQPLAKERMISDWYRLIHTSVRRTTAISKSTDPSLGPFFAEDTKQSTAEINSLQQKVEPLLEGDDEKALYKEMMANRKLYVASRDKIVALKKEDKLDEAAEELNQRFIPYGKAYLGSLGGLLDHQRNSMDSQALQIEGLYESNRTFMIGLGLLVLVLGVAYAWRLTRGITGPLGQAVAIAEAVAHRDLTSHIEVTSMDETGRLLQSLQKMNDGLISIVTEVRNGTENIATASNQIAAGNLDLSGRTEEQASSLEETASSMEELTATVKQNADNARQANQLAVKASEVAQRGGGVVSEVVSTMEAINGSSRKIADIISVIDGIAFQTNILALNAAVEAARAGEQGRGFAVVASEVRNLAQRSAAAAKEIKGLIDDSLDKVDAGSMLVSQAGTTMTEVVESIQRVTDIMGEITSATQEQSSGIEQVNMAIGQMDQVTQQNAALVEEAAAAAASLHDQADALTAIVAVFKLHETPAASTRLQLR